MADSKVEASKGAEEYAAEHGLSVEDVYEAGYFRSDDKKVLKSHVQAYLDDEDQDEGESYDVLNRNSQYVRTFEPSRHEEPKKLAEAFLEKHYPDGELRSPSAVPKDKRV